MAIHPQSFRVSERRGYVFAALSTIHLQHSVGSEATHNLASPSGGIVHIPIETRTSTGTQNFGRRCANPKGQDELTTLFEKRTGGQALPQATLCGGSCI